VGFSLLIDATGRRYADSPIGPNDNEASIGRRKPGIRIIERLCQRSSPALPAMLSAAKIFNDLLSKA
jgi:hypothetical protein